MKNQPQSKSKLPLFCIVIPSFNQGHFISQTIESILTQEGVEVKVFVMDGGSQDNTVETLKSFGNKINWVSEADNGQADAINKGLKKVFHYAEGASESNQYFAYLNSDDYYYPDALAKVAHELERQDQAQWLVGECEIVDENGKPIQSMIQKYKSFWRRFLNANILQVLNPIPQPAVVMKLKAVEKVGYFNTRLNYTMDYEYWLRLARECGPPASSKKVLAAFRIHGSSKGSTNYKKQFAEELKVARQMNSNPVLLGLHWLHTQLILLTYSIIKT